MDSLYDEAVKCTRGEENARALLESIYLQTEDSKWLEYATTLAHHAVIDYQTRAVEVTTFSIWRTPLRAIISVCYVICVRIPVATL